MRTEDWVLSEGISFKSRDCSESERGTEVNSPNKKVLSNQRRTMEGGDPKPPPYNYGAIPTADSGYSAPPPYPPPAGNWQ